jgi:hypothetical protein
MHVDHRIAPDAPRLRAAPAAEPCPSIENSSGDHQLADPRAAQALAEVPRIAAGAPPPAPATAGTVDDAGVIQFV